MAKVLVKVCHSVVQSPMDGFPFRSGHFASLRVSMQPSVSNLAKRIIPQSVASFITDSEKPIRVSNANCHSSHWLAAEFLALASIF